MRKISEEAARRFRDGKGYYNGNTFVKVENNITTLYLHDNPIAMKDKDNILITTSGWDTKTTFERLNSLFEILQLDLIITKRKGDVLLFRKVKYGKDYIPNPPFKVWKDSSEWLDLTALIMNWRSE